MTTTTPEAAFPVTTDTLAERLDALFAPYATPIGRDLKLNLKKYLLDGALAPLDAAPTLLALAETTGDAALGEAATRWMESLAFPAEQIRAARARQDALRDAGLRRLRRQRLRVVHRVARAGAARSRRLDRAAARPGPPRGRREGGLAAALSPAGETDQKESAAA